MNFLAKENHFFGTHTEYEFRLAIFTKNYFLLKNQKDKENKTSTISIDKFPDRTTEEYKKIFGFKKMETTVEPEVQMFDESNLADEISSDTKGAVTPVKH